MLEQEEGSHLSHTACCKTAVQCLTIDEQLLDLKLWLMWETGQLSTHLVLPLKVDNDIFQREASLFTQASEHFFDGLAISCGGQRGTAVG